MLAHVAEIVDKVWVRFGVPIPTVILVSEKMVKTDQKVTSFVDLLLDWPFAIVQDGVIITCMGKVSNHPLVGIYEEPENEAAKETTNPRWSARHLGVSNVVPRI